VKVAEQAFSQGFLVSVEAEKEKSESDKTSEVENKEEGEVATS